MEPAGTTASPDEEEATFENEFERYIQSSGMMLNGDSRSDASLKLSLPEDELPRMNLIEFGQLQNFNTPTPQRSSVQPEQKLDPRVAVPELDRVGALAAEFEEPEGQSEDENFDDFKKGGYHPVFIGEILIGRYVILQKLGWGHFSTVWLARDTKYQTYVAIKVQKSANHYLEAAFDEVEILQKAVKHSLDPQWVEDLDRFFHGQKKDFGRDDCHVVQLLNAFIYQGPYGKHFCMVFEILGVNLLEVIKRCNYKGIPLPICRKISRQILLGLHYLHKYCGIIDTDLKPENILICLDKSELKQIYDKGQLNRNKKFEERTRLIQKKIKAFQGTVEEAPAPEKKPEPTKELPLVVDEKSSETAVKPESLATSITLDQSSSTIMKDGAVAAESINKGETPVIPLANDSASQASSVLGNSESSLVAAQTDASLQAADPKLKVPKEQLEKSGLGEDFNIKIADLGNGCWVHHHFQPEIQTRQYRSPETILGVNYNETADIWSFACTLFEMLTGEYFFDPKKNQNFSKSEDHLALMMELLNKFPRSFSTVGKNSKHFVDIKGNLKKINGLNFVALKDLFVKSYNILESEAEALADFMVPMLRVDPRERASAAELLNHPWLDMKTTQFLATPSDVQANPKAYDKTLSDKSGFHRATEEEDFNADTSFIGESDDPEEEAEPIQNFYDKEIKFFDRNFKNVYVGYDDGIDLNSLDDTANWQFDKKVHC